MASSTTDNSLSAGVSIGSQSLELVMIEGSGSVRLTKKTALDLERPVVDQIHELIIESDLPYRALGIAVPGIVDRNGVIVESRLAVLKGLDLRGELGELVDGHITIENDANAAAFAEWKIGAGNGRKDLFRIWLDEGVGAGLVIDGKLWRGSSGFAGEIGSIVVDDEGNRLEDIASIPSIVRRTKNRYHQDSTSILNKLEENQIELKDISAAAALEDDLALLMFERTGVAIGTVIAAVINTLNIQMVILAGEPTLSNPVLLEAVIKRVKECTIPAVFEKTELAASEILDFPAAIGAGLLSGQAE